MSAQAIPVPVYWVSETDGGHGAHLAGNLNPGEKAASDGQSVEIEGELYLNVYTFGDEDPVDDPVKKRVCYIKKRDFDNMSVETVNIPANFAGLEAEAVPTRLMEQLFRVVEVVEDEDCVTITARHVWYDNLQNYTLWEADKDTKYSAAAVCRNVLNNAISPPNMRVASDCTDTMIGKDLDYQRKNLVEAFLDPENGICAKFGLSMIRYNWDAYCLKNVGYDRGLVIQNGKNLLGVERTESVENLITRVAPIGKTKKGDIVWLDYNGKRYIDSQYIGDYSYPRVEIYDTGIQVGKDDVTTNNIQDKLLEAAQKRFSEDKVDLPEVTMKIEFLSLGDTEEYAQYRNLDKVYLFDILTIKDTIRGYSYSAQVIGVEHDILTGMLLSVTIGSLENWDGTRKIATWQVPEVSGENIRLKSIMAGSFEAEAIQAEDLGAGVIAYAHIAQATIDQLTTDSMDAVYAHIHELIAGRITAEDIQAGSITAIALAANAVTADAIDAGAVTADKIAANAVTADKILAGAVTAIKIAANAITSDKLVAGAVTAEKVAANAINADKIDATAISAINAKLGTATIANGYIQNANIDYARVKDISADEAIITTSITEQGIADRLFINRLQITYGQMVAATIGDLVIGANNGNYYHVDVEWDEDGIPSLVPTQVDTPTAEEIESGHTADGKTIIGDVGTFAELSSEDFYAINGIIDRITAKRIDVDELWARQAFINQLMVTDISSNTYIQSTIGDWQSGSTITQTIAGINSRISSLGYGTIFYSTTEPDPTGVVVGDVWIEPIDDNTWDQIAVHTWEELEGWTWDQVAGQYRMYVWTGEQWKLLYDNLIVSELMTEINQTAYAVTLKADKSVVDTLSEDVTAFGAILEVQAEQISAAVSSVNSKASSYTQLTDPADDPEISLSIGDMWVKAAGDGTWASLEEFTWDELASLTWDELGGASVYSWDGSGWIQTADYGAVVQNRTLIELLDTQIRLEAEARKTLGDNLEITRAELVITTESIAAEVLRATTAEGGKIDKTTQYQTADSIVTEAVRQSGVNANANFIAKTSTYQDAESIKAEAVRVAGINGAEAFLAKTTAYQTADAIVTEAVRQAGVNAGSAYIAKTTQYQTANAIVTEAVRQSTASASGSYIAKTTIYQTAQSIVAAAEAYTNNNAYTVKSGITITANGVDVSGNKHINLDVNASNYVHISSAGIDMKGSRVSVNGKDMWARDDILILKNGESESSVIASMAGKHDWVLIKPYYTATIRLFYSSRATAGYKTVYQLNKDSSGETVFGTGSDWYRYVLTATVANPSASTSVTANFTVMLSNNSDMSNAVSYTVNSVTIRGSSTDITLDSGQLANSANLFTSEDNVVYMRITSNHTFDNVTNLKIDCTCAATTSKVPCTVYYFP